MRYGLLSRLDSIRYLWLTTCNSEGMILIVTPTAGAEACARSIQQATSQPVQSAHSSQEASTFLRGGEYAAVVFDQLFLDAEPEAAEQLLDHLAGATPLYVNLAIHGMERVTRQVRAAMQRRKTQEQGARLSAQRMLRSELSETVTAMLLSCDMALSMRGLPEPAHEKLRTLHDLARELSARLGQPG